MSEEIKNCPLCEKKPRGILGGYLACANDKCDLFNISVAVDKWQARPIEDALNARIAELKPIIDKLVEGIDSLTSGFPLEIEYIEAVEIAKDWKKGRE